MRNYLDECPCGSGLFSQAEFDNHGIFVFYSCDKCDKEKRSKYNPAIFDDYDQYEQNASDCGEIIDSLY